MDTIIALLVLLPLLFAAWRAWRTTMRDYVRDQLFELRDEWREKWLAPGLDMREHAYADVRDYVNAALRYTSEFRMVELIYYAARLPRHPAGKLEMMVARTGRRDVDALAVSICHRTVRLLQLYMIATSMLLIPTILLALATIALSLAHRPLMSARRAAGRIVDGLAFTRRSTIEAALRVA